MESRYRSVEEKAPIQEYENELMIARGWTADIRTTHLMRRS